MIVTIKYNLIHSFLYSVSNDNLLRHMVSSNCPIHTFKKCITIHFYFEFSLPWFWEYWHITWQTIADFLLSWHICQRMHVYSCFIVLSTFLPKNSSSRKLEAILCWSFYNPLNHSFSSSLNSFNKEHHLSSNSSLINVPQMAAFIVFFIFLYVSYPLSFSGIFLVICHKQHLWRVLAITSSIDFYIALHWFVTMLIEGFLYMHLT